MFFRCRPRFGIGRLLLLLLGFKVVRRSMASEEDRQAYRAKARQFRNKLREAYAVWDDEACESDATTANEED